MWFRQVNGLEVNPLTNRASLPGIIEALAHRPDEEVSLTRLTNKEAAGASAQSLPALSSSGRKKGVSTLRVGLPERGRARSVGAAKAPQVVKRARELSPLGSSLCASFQYHWDNHVLKAYGPSLPLMSKINPDLPPDLTHPADQ
jgi:hypothetical protein